MLAPLMSRPATRRSSHDYRRIRYMRHTAIRLSVYEKWSAPETLKLVDDAVDTLYRMLTRCLDGRTTVHEMIQLDREGTAMIFYIDGICDPAWNRNSPLLSKSLQDVHVVRGLGHSSGPWWRNMSWAASDTLEHGRGLGDMDVL